MQWKPEYFRALATCVAEWDRVEMPESDRIICCEHMEDMHFERFAEKLHQTWLLALERRGCLVKAHAVRGGGRRYYQLANPVMARIMTRRFMVSVIV